MFLPDDLSVGQGLGTEGQGAEGNAGEGAPQPEQTIPYKRFEEIYGKMKDYEGQLSRFKQIGDPNSASERLKKLEQWEKQVEDYRQKQNQTPTEQAEAQRVAAIRKELLKVYPELNDVNTVKELKAQLAALQQNSQQSVDQATLKDMSTRFADTLKAAKIDAKYQTKIEEYLVSQMSEEERQEFVKGDFTIAERIFTNELKDGLFSAMKAKPVLQAPAVRHTPGGTPPQSKVQKARTLAEAAEDGWNRINSGE